MSNLKEIEFNKVCRTCLSSSEDMKSLYATDSGLTYVCFADMLMSFTPLKLSNNDGFPTQICCICISELSQFHTFQLKCIQSENILQNCKENIVHTEETNDSEQLLIKMELPTYTDNINSTVQSYATTKSLQDPLTISTGQKETSQELDLIKPEFVNIKIEMEDVINTPVTQEPAKFPEIHVKSLSTTRVKSLKEMNKLAIGQKLYTCTVCDSMFADAKCLMTHKRTHISEKPYSGTQNIHLFRHTRSHNEKSSSGSDSSLGSDFENKQSCAATTSLQDPLTIAEVNKELSQQLDLIKHELIDVKIDNKHDINIKSNSSLVNLSEETTTHSLLNETSERPYSCTVCVRKFKREIYLNRHLVKHSGKKPYTCTVCNHSFTLKHHFTNHMKTHTGEKQYTCTFCNRCFILKSQLTVHLRNHSGEKPFTCTECNKSFASQQYLTSHMLTHNTKEKQFACTLCVRRFTLKAQLTAHLRTHSAGKPYTCTECNKSYTCQKHLRTHMLIHTGEKPYACAFCDKCFALKCHLTVHLRMHTGEKPYTCTICNSSFNRKDFLTKHLQWHSKNECTFCDKSFARSNLLKVHLRTHTGG